MSTEMEQTTLGDAGDRHQLTGADDPEIGVTLDERTHRAHVRYAAADELGVVWFDPRDGRERYGLREDVPLAAFDDDDDRVLTSVAIRPHRPGEAPDGRYCLHRHFAYIETLSRYVGGRLTDTVSRVSSCRDSEVFESIEAARDWCREHVDGYADAPRRDAVRERT